MTKSIFTGLGVVVMFAVIMAGLAGAYELTAPLAVAWLFLFVVFAILFAGFGGFKPFFAASDAAESSPIERQQPKDSSTRRLISVGAEVDETQSLFGEREPLATNDATGTPMDFGDSKEAKAEGLPPRAPLFGEALSDQLDSERAETQRDAEAVELESTGIKWADDADDTPPEDDAETADAESPEQHVDEGAEGEEVADDLVVDPDEDSSAEGVGIVVDDDPDWVADEDGADEDALIDALDDGGDSEVEVEVEDVVEAIELPADDETEDEVEVAEAEIAAAEINDELDTVELDTVELDEDVELVEAAELELEADEHDVVETEVLEVEPTEVVEVVEAESSGDEPGVDIEDIDAEKLAAALDSIEPADPSESTVEVDYVSEPVVTASTGLSVGSGTELPVVVQTPAPVELHKYSSSEIMAVVKTQEGHLVDTLIDEGVLSTQGPLTDKDIRTMVFVAVSSTELIEVLTEGQKDAVALNGGGNHALESGS